jgi:cytochrome P450
MDYSPYDTEIHSDPYPVYEHMRRECPVFHNEDFDFWALFRFDDVQAALKDWQTYTTREGTFLKHEIATMREFMPEEGKFLDMDPPRSVQLRRLLRDAFAPEAIQLMEGEIRSLVIELIDRFATKGSADLIREFASPLPVTIISGMIGISAEDQDDVSEWSHRMFDRNPDDGKATPEAYEAGHRLREYFNAMIEDRRLTPRADIMTQLVQAEVDGAPLTVNEIVGMALLLYAAGNDTTGLLIGSTLLLLGQRPDERERLIRDPSAIPAAIEEVLRYESPICQDVRTTTRDVEVGGTTIPAGKNVILVLGSANRDEGVFPQGEDMDLTRNIKRHLAFGEGVHFCLGAQLARVEARIAIEEFLKRVPEYEITGAIEWSQASVLRGPVTLPARF